MGQLGGSRSVTISPNGSVVYVTGYSDGGQTTGYDYLTIAYHAATGATLWARRWVGLVNVPLNNTDAADGLALSPGGGTLYVTGNAANTAGKWNYATVAYNAATGTKLWVASYAGPADGDDAPTAIATNPATGRCT